MCFFFTWTLCASEGTLGVPPASWTGHTSSSDTVGMLGHVFDHQPPLTRPLQAVETAWSAIIVCKYGQKPMEINDNQWESMKTNGNQWKTNGNLWKSLILRSSRRRRRPPRVAWAPPDDQTQCLTSPQCPMNMLGQSSRPGGCLGWPHVLHRLHVKKNTGFAIKNDH